MKKLGTFVVFLGGLLALVFLLRSALLTEVARRMLAKKEVVCEGLALSLDATMSTIRVAPMTCTLPSGPMARVGVVREGVIELSGLQPSSVFAPEIRLEQRTGELPQVGGVLTGQLSASVREALKELSSFASKDLPAVRIEQLSLVRGERVLSVRNVLAQNQHNTLTVTVSSVQSPVVDGRRISVRAGIEALTLRTTDTQLDVQGRVQMSLGVRPLAMDRSVGFRVQGQHMNAERPDFSVSFDRSDARSELLQRLQALSGT